MRVASDSFKTNLVDVLTKLMPASKKKDICGKFMRRWWNHQGINVWRTFHTCLWGMSSHGYFIWSGGDQILFMVQIGTWAHCKCGWFSRNIAITIIFALESVVGVGSGTMSPHEFFCVVLGFQIIRDNNYVKLKSYHWSFLGDSVNICILAGNGYKPNC